MKIHFFDSKAKLSNKKITLILRFDGLNILKCVLKQAEVLK